MQAKQIIPLLTILVLLFSLSCSGVRRPKPADFTFEPTDPALETKVLETGTSKTAAQETLLLSFIGDIMAHKMNFERPPYKNIWEGLDDTLLLDDLTFGNLEFPVVPELPMAGYPFFNNHLPYVEAAIDAGVDVYSCANNHTTDKGAKGVVRTYEVMQDLQFRKGIFFSGISQDPEEPMKMTAIQRNGFTVGFIAITEFLNAYAGMNYVYLVDFKNKTQAESFLSFIEKEKEKYDIVVVSVHAGVEYARYPAEYKINYFREMIKAGVDIVWGHHPHVLQPWEIINADGIKRLIIYSAGNFISGQIWFLDPLNPHPIRRYTGDSVVFQVRIGRLEDDRASIFSVDPLHFSNYKDPAKGMVVKHIDALLKSNAVPAGWRLFYDDKYFEIRRFLQDRTEMRQIPQ